MEIEKLQELPEPQKIEEAEIPQNAPVKSHKKMKKILVKKERKEAIQIPNPAEDLEEKEILQEIAKPKNDGKTEKKPRTVGQIASFLKAQEVRKANAIKRKEEMNILADQQKKELEKKILKKALAIKKREVRSRLVLDTIEDDEEPVESVLEKARKIASKTPRPVAPVTPQWVFA